MKEGTALIVCDIQKDIMQMHGHDEEAHRMVATTRRLIEWARTNGVAVIYSCIGFRPDFVDALPAMRGQLSQYNVLVANTPGTQVIDELAPQDGDFIIVRNRVSSFYNTNLEVILQSVKAQNLVITGCSTARVVESTARDANDRGLRAIVVSDGCSASTPEFHANALKSLGDFFAKIMTGEEVIAALS